MASANGKNGSAPSSSPQIKDGDVRALGEMMTNILSRMEIMRGMQIDPRKDVYDSCRLPPNGGITPEMYWNMFDREAVAQRAIEVLPRESWQVQPTVFESEDSEEITDFEDGWDGLGRQIMGEESWHADEEANPIWEYLLRGDIFSRVQQYGGILVGVSDGKDLSEPAEFVNDGGDRKLLYLRAFPQYYAKILEWDQDEKSPRYCKPIMYECTMNDPKNLTLMGSGTNAPVGMVKKVHWTRFVHFCDGGETLATEVMRPIFNNLVGLQKLYCGSPEMYWRGAFPGIGFKTPTAVGPNVKINTEELSKMMEAYAEDFQRWFAVKNLEPIPFAPQVVDPTPQIMTQIQAICIKLGIPMRVFMGSERGELASSQDDAAWNDRLKLRQKFYITPRIIIPFVNRLIALGILPTPQQFHVYWPDLTSQTAGEKADVAVKKTTALNQYVSGQAETIMAPLDFYVNVMDMEEEEATQILENAAEHVLEQQQQQMEQQAQLMEEMASQPIPGIDVGPDGQPIDQTGQQDTQPQQGASQTVPVV